MNQTQKDLSIPKQPLTDLDWQFPYAAIEVGATQNVLLIFQPLNGKWEDVTIDVWSNPIDNPGQSIHDDSVASITGIFPPQPGDNFATYTITGKAEGTAIIIATDGSLTTELSVAVLNSVEPVTDLTFDSLSAEYTLNEQGSAGGSVYLTGTPGSVDISYAEFSSSDESVCTITYNNKYIENDEYVVVCSIDCHSEGTATVTATCGDVTASCDIIVHPYVPPAQLESIALPEDFPATIGAYNQSTGHYEGTVVFSPENADISGLIITSSEPSMLEATLGLMDKSQLELGTTPAAVDGTSVTVTIEAATRHGVLTDSKTVTISL